MGGDLAGQLSQICEDQSMEEKKLANEGNRLLSQLKEGLLKNEHLSQDRDKWRIKVAATPPSKVSVISSMTSDETNKKLQKLHACEQALLENAKIVTQFKSEFRNQMPKIFSGFRTSKSSFFVNMKMELMEVADSIQKCHRNNDSVTQRLKSHISATSLTPHRGLNKNVLMGFESMLQSSIGAIITEEETLQNRSDNASTPPSTSSTLDMSLESTACLAASSPAVIPSLPSTFRQAVGHETCVWFNAFSGRVYRDAARSKYFHSWLLEKLTAQLNKGTRPGYIDEVKVESVTFGATPPLLFNVQWSPPVVRKQKGRGKESGTKTGSTGSNDNSTPSDQSEAHIDSSDIDSPHTPIESASHNEDSKEFPRRTGGFDSDGGHPTRPAPTHDPTHTAQSEGPFDEDTEGESPFGIPTQDIDEDIECTADMAFRSGLKFKISTRSVLS